MVKMQHHWFAMVRVCQLECYPPAVAAGQCAATQTANQPIQRRCAQTFFDVRFVVATSKKFQLFGVWLEEFDAVFDDVVQVGDGFVFGPQS